MTQNAIEDALAAYTRPPDTPRQKRIEDAHTLNSHGVFSKRNIVAITGLPAWVIDAEIEKNYKTGGRFNPEMLPLIHDFHQSLDGQPDVSLFRMITSQGVSFDFLCKLTGVPKSTMQYRTRDAAANIR